jgi:hypothetical protein
MGGPSSSACSIALRIMLPQKPHHCVKVGIPLGGFTKATVVNNLVNSNQLIIVIEYSVIL